MLPVRALWVGPIPLTVTAFLAVRCPYASATTSPYFSCSASPASTARSIRTQTPSVCWFATCSIPMASSPHIKARCPLYLGSETCRFPVPDDKVSWETDWPEYQPVNYTAPPVLARPFWADPDIGSFSPRFNTLDGTVDRRSHEGEYRVQDNKPLNPRGRTGVTGRGLLGRWGPNHAADPIVTRWKRDGNGQQVIHTDSQQPVLQFVAIVRKDCGEWAIPGGMVDPGELVSLTLQREFSEEALNLLSASPEEKAQLREHISKLFSSPRLQVYKGYVDDPRNTDNAWMETVAVNFHDELGDSRQLLRRDRLTGKLTTDSCTFGTQNQGIASRKQRVLSEE
ncbi:ADP-ribose pyrophosphatase, mitochondrial isoform X1 [Arapaima gigas]